MRLIILLLLLTGTLTAKPVAVYKGAPLNDGVEKMQAAAASENDTIPEIHLKDLAYQNVRNELVFRVIKNAYDSSDEATSISKQEFLKAYKQQLQDLRSGPEWGELATATTDTLYNKFLPGALFAKFEDNWTLDQLKANNKEHYDPLIRHMNIKDANQQIPFSVTTNYNAYLEALSNKYALKIALPETEFLDEEFKTYFLERAQKEIDAPFRQLPNPPPAK